jgi:hypothetical protein
MLFAKQIGATRLCNQTEQKRFINTAPQILMIGLFSFGVAGTKIFIFAFHIAKTNIKKKQPCSIK